MSRPFPFLCAAVAIVALASPSPSQGSGGLGGIIVPASSSENCITGAELTALPWNLSALPDTPSNAFVAYPQAGTLGEDLFIGAYLDHDPSPGILDWHCTGYTYDTHLGADSEIRSFGEQLIGVPVFAAADGTVVGTDDGHPDMNTVWAGQPANYVIVDHGGGRLGYYWHLRSGSVAVSVGQTVKAGQQLGQTGSSGNSGGPHLHFEVHDAGNPVDPWSGACRPGATLWKDQPAWNGTLGFRDFGVCRNSPGSSGYPYASPHDPQLLLSDPSIYFWALIQNLPANSTWSVRFLRPDGTLSYQTPVFPFNNPLWTRAWIWWNWNIWEMHTIPGTWTVVMEVNGQVMVSAPVDVVATLTPGFNRPPQPVTAAILPAVPTASDVLVCRVQQPLLLDDLDWDIVRFTYTWRVNGTVVRTVTSAGRTDQLPHHVAAPGNTVTCTVVPSDGQANGPSAIASTIIQTLGCFPAQVSVAVGGAVEFTLDLGPGQAGAPYIFGGSVSGTSPGVPLAPGLVLPLVYDSVTDYCRLYPNTPPYANSLGALSPQGMAGPVLTLPPLPQMFTGLTLYHAAFIVGSPWAVSNPVAFQLVQ